MKLATVDDVLEFIRFDGIEDDLNTSIGLALDMATHQLEGQIRLETFDRTVGYDLFDLRHYEVDPGLYHYHWKLSNGFVDSGQTFTIEVAAEIADFGTNDASDITSDAQINYDKGLISVLDSDIQDIRIPGISSRLLGNYVRVDYTSGFLSQDSECYDDVPEWLKLAAINTAIINLDSSQPEVRHSDGFKARLDQTQMMLGSLLTKKIRYYPKYQKPVFKTI